MPSAKAKAQRKWEERERRPTDHLDLKEVPACPYEAEIFSHDDQRVYDAVLDGHPCRWRFDRQGLKVFIRYYPDHRTANAFPWKAIYDRDGRK